MSTENLRVALITSLDDRLVAPLRRSLDEVEKELKQVEAELKVVSSEGRKAGQTLASMQGPQQAARQAAELVRNTERAVTLADRLRQAWSATGNIVRGVASGIGAFQAARMVVAPQLQEARTYDRALADAANTAYADRDTAGRMRGMRDLDATVVAGLRAGGGNRDQTLAALNEMLASGSVTPDQARNLLPVAAKYATAGNTGITDISMIVVRALQNGFKEADIPRMLDMALKAGQEGGFELKDMAKWLPKLLAAGQMSGLTTISDYGRILASAQGSVITAGSKDEAGNNLLNLLLKINSSDTAQDAKKLGIDLSGSLAAARAKGVNSLDAFVNLTDQIAAKDPRMAALRRKAAQGTDEDLKASFESQAAILQGSAIGKIVQDRQALMPLVAELNKRDYIRNVNTELGGARGQFGSANFELISKTADFQVQQQENERLFALTRGVEGANGAIGRLSELTTELYRKYPDMAQAVEGTTLALKALTAAAYVFAGLSFLKGAKALATGAGGAAAGGAGAGAGAAAAAVGGGLAIGGTALAAAVVGLPILGVGMALSDRANSGRGLGDRIASRNARLQELDALIASGRDGGAAPGYMARLESERAGLATDRDGLSQRLANMTGGGRGFINPSISAAADALNAQATPQQAATMERAAASIERAAAELKELSTRPVVLQVDGREIARAANDFNATEGRRR